MLESPSVVEVLGALLYSFIKSINNASETQTDNLFCQKQRDDIWVVSNNVKIS